MEITWTRTTSGKREIRSTRVNGVYICAIQHHKKGWGYLFIARDSGSRHLTINSRRTATGSIAVRAAEKLAALVVNTR